MKQISQDEKLTWALLACLEAGVGAGALRQLHSWLENNHLSVREFWAEAEKWAPLAGWKSGRLAAIQALRERFTLDAWVEYLAARGIGVLHISDDAYPPLLRFIPDYAPVLFYRGDPGILAHGGLAVVGARAVTAYGRAVIEELIDAHLSGVTIISGMMNGVDELAHRRALAGGLATAAFLGYGLQHVWPRFLADLPEAIVASGGVVISEFAPWVAPLPRRFPMRNRLVAGSSVATLVVEAAEKSGSLITANLALDYGREVMSVPGPIFSQLSLGTLELIRKGATPVGSSAQILQVLAGCKLMGKDEDFYANLLCLDNDGQHQNAQQRVNITDPWQIKVWEELGGRSVSSEELCERLGAEQEVMTAVAMLELAGYIVQGADGRWGRGKW